MFRETGAVKPARFKALKDPEEAAAYLDAVMSMADPAALLRALRQVAKAKAWPKWPAALASATRPCFVS